MSSDLSKTPLGTTHCTAPNGAEEAELHPDVLHYMDEGDDF